MHIANIKVPSEWTKLVDLIHIGRNKFEVKAGETYYIHNNSDFIIYAVESEEVPTEDIEAKRIYAGKSAGYVKVAGDLYVCSKLPNVYPYPATISMIFCNDVIATEAALKVIADKVDLKASLADVDGLLFRVGRMEDKVAALEKTNTEPVAAEAANALNLTDVTKDYVVSGDIAKAAAISGKTVTLKDVAVNDATLALNAEKDVELKSVNLTGTYPSNKGKVIKNDNAEYVTVKDSTFDASAAYNMVEIGLEGTTLPKGVLIENCKFTGNYTNNAILIFGTQDNAVININNCYFEHVSNVLRLSNKTNAKNVTVNITNCKCDHWDTNPQWAGLLICQDYTSGSTEKAEENNLFAPDKITINVSNLITPDGTLLEAPKDMATIAGSFDDKQVFYLSDNYRGSVAYDAAKYPAINIL